MTQQNDPQNKDLTIILSLRKLSSGMVFNRLTTPNRPISDNDLAAILTGWAESDEQAFRVMKDVVNHLSEDL